MNNKQFVERASKAAGVEGLEITALTGAIGGALTTFAHEQMSVAIPGFGTFVPLKRDEYIERDAATGASTLVPPNLALAFQPSIVLRKKLS